MTGCVNGCIGEVKSFDGRNEWSIGREVTGFVNVGKGRQLRSFVAGFQAARCFDSKPRGILKTR